jgi:uncharacterized protein YbjT (DUF2867 family)
MKVLILGAAGQIPGYLIPMLLEQTDAHLVLYARNSGRIKPVNPACETIVEGDINDVAALTEAMKGIDIVFINPVIRDLDTAKTIKEAMQQSGVKRIIVTSILGIYDEVPGAFGEWNRHMVGAGGIARASTIAKWFETSGLDYTLLRLTWLYNQDGNVAYQLTQKGEPFEGAQVTRQAVAQLIVDIVKDTSGKFANTSLGVSEPNTNWDKPSFY